MSEIGHLVAARRMKLAVNCMRHRKFFAGETSSSVRQRKGQERERGRRKSNVIDVLIGRVAVENEGELATCMMYRDVCSIYVRPRLLPFWSVSQSNVSLMDVADRLCSLAVRNSLRNREVRGSFPDRVKPRTLTLVLAADPPSVWHYGFSVKSGQPGVRIM
ncbi:hypothetical protein ElyMa_002885200 [Elysia marginata]|uniref:Uncharacterized protein n=1 Tax=Elysia marginata TaxID=1093978 RepID=A0AAV4HYP4_9GAST|nr:hypothetical protein ElyMa_002885200 [Elysia marginata]